MGNDGGSIPKRRELVKEAAKALTSAQIKEAQAEQQEYGWSTDPLTRKPLAQPIVSDAAGILYNKDSIIEYLLKDDDDADKAEMRKTGGVKGTAEGGFADLGTFGDRVKGLKDVVEINFTEAEDSSDRRGGDRWVCPITGTSLGPGAKAVYVVPCGHAFAGSVVKEVAGSACLTCNEPYAENDIIHILPTLPTDIARLNLRVKTLKEKGLTHSLKKAPGSKKRKKAHRETNNGDDNTPTTSTTENGTNPSKQPPTTTSSSSDEAKKKKKNKNKTKSARKDNPPLPALALPAASNGIKNASTASLTRKVMQEQEIMNKRRKLAQNDNVNSLFNKSENKPKLANSADYMTRGFSIGKEMK